MKILTETKEIIYRTEMAAGRSEKIGVFAAAAAVGGALAEGGEVTAVTVRLLMPLKVDRPHMYAVEKQIRRFCREKEIELAEICEIAAAQVTEYTAEVTAIARAPEEEAWYRETMRAGQDIVLTKWIALDGTLRILSEQEDRLKERFAAQFLRQIAMFEPELFDAAEIADIREHGASYIEQVGEGGIFAALWRLAQEAGSGLEVDLKKIPIRQETIEVCEHFRINPYQLASAGNFLIAAENGETLVRQLAAKNIPAAVIGRLKADKNKMIRNGEDVRYIDRPAPDEINKLINGGYYERDQK